MKRELDGDAVRARLARLRTLCVPESVDEARARLARDVPEEPFEEAVARRLRTLRALCELTNALQRGKPL